MSCWVAEVAVAIRYGHEEEEGGGGGRQEQQAWAIWSIKAVRSAPFETLESLPWLPAAVAQAVYAKLHAPPERATGRGQ